MNKDTIEIEVNDNLKFVWSYLILNGIETTGEWSYYGASWKRNYEVWSTNDILKRKEELCKKVLEFGIDFQASGIPEISDEVGFTDTFNDSSEHTATLGKLVLKNGETFLLGSDDDDAAALVRTAREMMKKPNESDVEKFAKLL